MGLDVRTWSSRRVLFRISSSTSSGSATVQLRGWHTWHERAVDGAGLVLLLLLLLLRHQQRQQGWPPPAALALFTHHHHHPPVKLWCIAFKFSRGTSAAAAAAAAAALARPPSHPHVLLLRGTGAPPTCAARPWRSSGA